MLNELETQVPLRAVVHGAVDMYGAVSTKTYDFIGFDHDNSEHPDWPGLFTPPYAQCNFNLDFPKFPDTFSLKYEANILEKSHTVYVEEDFDYDLNAMRKRTFNKDGAYVDHLQRDDKVYEVTDGLVCEESPEDHKSHTWMRQHDSSGHLKHAGQLMAWGNNYGYKYTGVKKVRGIACDSWRANITHAGSFGTVSYDLDYYFSAKAWSTRGAQDIRTPVRVHLKGFFARADVRGGGKHTMEHFYDFTDFHPSSPKLRDLEVFSIPTVCPSRYGSDSSAMGVIFSFEIILGPMTKRLYSQKRVVVQSDLADYLGVAYSQVSSKFKPGGFATRRAVQDDRVDILFVVTTKEQKKHSHRRHSAHEAVTKIAERLEEMRQRYMIDQNSTLTLGGAYILGISEVKVKDEVDLAFEYQASGLNTEEEETDTGVAVMFGIFLGFLIAAIVVCLVQSLCLEANSNTDEADAPWAGFTDQQTDRVAAAGASTAQSGGGLPGCLDADGDSSGEIAMMPMEDRFPMDFAYEKDSVSESRGASI